LCAEPEGAERLRAYQRLYEPYVHALADRLLIAIPGWSPATGKAASDNWQTSAWEKQSKKRSGSASTPADDEHA
jgi:hypothetical protein